MTFNDLRIDVAALTARLIAEEGITDFALAKRKAARHLGITQGEAMPTNAEVDQALHEYRQLFRDEEDDERLHLMRQAAVEVMRVFSPFTPYLTGVVWEGTAGAFSEVELDIYADSAKEVEIFMLNQHIEYKHDEPRKAGHYAPEAVLDFDWQGIPFKLTIYGTVALRAPRRNVVGGRVIERASIEQVIALLATEKATDKDDEQA